MIPELNELRANGRIESRGRRARGANRNRRTGCGRLRRFRRFGTEQRYDIRLHLVIGAAPVFGGGDQLVEVRNELRELRAGIALHLGGTGKLRQLAERVARSGEVTLGTFRIDLRCPSRRLLCLRGGAERVGAGG